MSNQPDDVFEEVRPDIIVGADPAVGVDTTVVMGPGGTCFTISSLDDLHATFAEEIRALSDPSPPAE